MFKCKKSKTLPECAIKTGLDNSAAEKIRPPLDWSDAEVISGKIVVVTGATSGVGEAGAHEFARLGARLVLPCRNLGKGQKVVGDIKAKVPNAQVDLVEMDFDSLVSVRKGAEEIIKNYPHINILCNNAGLFADDVNKKTKDGFEPNMGVNHLGPFLFTNLLLDHVKKGAPSRIVFTSSMGHRSAELDFDDFLLEKRGNWGTYKMGPYFNSKLANIYTATKLAKMLNGSGVNTYAFCPGHVSTGFTANEGWLINKINDYIAIRPDRAAGTMIYCSVMKSTGGQTGLMYRANGIWEGAIEALDGGADEICWEKSCQLVGLPCEGIITY